MEEKVDTKGFLEWFASLSEQQIRDIINESDDEYVSCDKACKAILDTIIHLCGLIREGKKDIQMNATAAEKLSNAFANLVE